VARASAFYLLALLGKEVALASRKKMASSAREDRHSARDINRQTKERAPLKRLRLLCATPARLSKQACSL